MAGPWAIWDDCMEDGISIDAEEFKTYAGARREAQNWLDECEEHHLYPGKATKRLRRMCDGGPNGWCEGGCPRDEGPDDHTVEHLVWSFEMKERKGMKCGDIR